MTKHDLLVPMLCEGMHTGSWSHSNAAAWEQVEMVRILTLSCTNR